MEGRGEEESLPDDLPRLQDGSVGTSAYLDQLRADKLRLDVRLSVVEEHREHFARVRVQLVDRFSLPRAIS